MEPEPAKTPTEPGHFRVRAATPADVSAVLPMVRAVCALHEAWDPARYPMIPDVVGRYERWLPARATDPRSVFLVADTGAAEAPALVGFLIAMVETNIPIYRLTQFGFIHDMWVEASYRRRGVARALVVEALARFRTMGVEQVRLETAVVNEAARRFFGSCGFRTGTVDMLIELTPSPAGDSSPPTAATPP